MQFLDYQQFSEEGDADHEKHSPFHFLASNEEAKVGLPLNTRYRSLSGYKSDVVTLD
jgi:hypothetical protein